MTTARVLEAVGNPPGPELVAADAELRRRVVTALPGRNASDRSVVAAGVAVASSGGLAASGARRVEFHRHWYRSTIPFGRASLSDWYLFCRAMRETGDDAVAANVLVTDWLAAIHGSDNPIAATIACLGDEPGAAGHELSDDTGDADDFVKAVGIGAVVVPPGTGAGGAPDALGRVLAGGDAGARVVFTSMTDEDLTLLLVRIEQRLAALEQVRIRPLGDDALDNGGLRVLVDRCLGLVPEAWSASELVAVAALWAWDAIGFVLQELNESMLTIPSLARFLLQRLDGYRRVLRPGAEPAFDDVTDLPSLVGALRAALPAVEETHWRCLHFDGGTLERREFLLDRAVLPQHQLLPDDLVATLADRFGRAPSPAGTLDDWDAFLDGALEGGFTPSDVLIAVADWAANAPDLPVDMAIFTTPLGVKLDRPWDLEIDEIFSYTAFRSSFSSVGAGIPFDPTGIQNAIGQRMRYNAVKKAQNYAIVRRTNAQSFNLPDLSIAEDATHGGHAAAGIRLGCRIPTYVTWNGRTWKGIADVRLNRSDYESDVPFRPSELPVGFRYTHWAKGIADATYRRGLLFDPKYCVKIKRDQESDR